MKNSIRGNVLVFTLMIMGVIAAFVAIVMPVTSTVVKNTDRSSNYVLAQTAAEAAVEYAYGVWLIRTNNKHGMLTSTEANASLASNAPTFPAIIDPNDSKKTIYPGAVYVSSLRIDPINEYGVVQSGTAVPTGVFGKVPGYKGTFGTTYSYAATATMRAGSGRGNVAGVRRIFQYTQVPLCQWLYFFENVAELYIPATVTYNGPIHSNDSLYLFGTPNTINITGRVSSVNGTFDAESPWSKYWSGHTSASSLGPPIYTSGRSNQVIQVPRIEPMGGDPSTVFNTSDSNLDNDGFHELIEPPVNSATDPAAIATRRLYNKAGIIVAISGSTGATKTVTTGNLTTLTPAAVTAIQNAVTKKQNAIYDARETSTGLYSGTPKGIDVSTLDVAAFNAAIASGATNFNGVLYIYDTTTPTAADPTAIRLKNGSVLPTNGLTIASVNPVYVQGDYNLAQKPAAIAADAVVLLSNAWLDTNAESGDTLSNRTASATTYNTAIMAGFMKSFSTVSSSTTLKTGGTIVATSGTTATVGGTSTIVSGTNYYPEAITQGKDTAGNYSGGINNFPRFLENWSSKTCTYNGSMISLFESKTFNSQWNTTNIFSPPTRNWNFDTKYLTNPPPGMVDAVILTRGPWSKF